MEDSETPWNGLLEAGGRGGIRGNVAQPVERNGAAQYPEPCGGGGARRLVPRVEVDQGHGLLDGMPGPPLALHAQRVR